MNSYRHVRAQGANEITETKYPKFSISAALVLIYLTPFVSSLLSYIAFVICLYRVVRYDSRVFATDYCLLLPVAQLFATSGGFALIIYLSLFAGVWYVVRRGIRADSAYVFLFIILNYLILRMQMQIGRFMLCFGQLFVLCVLLPQQDAQSASRAAKTFCQGMIVSSLYALALRNTWQLQAVRGAEAEAIGGTGIKRFQGLMLDPNYFMTMVIIALALLVKLKEAGRLTTAQFLTMGVALVLFGILTYSKTFLLVFILLGGIYIVWQFWNRKVFSGMLLTIAAVVALLFLLFAENSPFAVVMSRLRSASDLNDLTTGRMDVYKAYWKEITASPLNFFFGKSFAAKTLYKDPHNLYLEIMYYTGTVGMALFAGFYGAMVRTMKLRTPDIRQQSVIAKYVVLFMVLVLYFTLHGMFSVITYGGFFLAFLSILITKKKEASQ